MSTKNRFVPLKTKIIIATLIPVIISFAIICVVIFSSLSKTLYEMTESKFLQVSQKYTYNFESKISSAMNYLTIVTSELEMKINSGVTDRELLQKTIFRIFDDYNSLDGSSVYFEPDMYDGKDAYYKGTYFGTETSGRICWYYYVEDGNTAYLPEAFENDEEFNLPHYANAKATNKPIYTDPVKYNVDGKDIFMFTLTHPVQDADGNFIGAVTVDIFLNDIYEQLQNESIYETGYVIIANDNHNVIYSPHYDDIGKSLEESGVVYELPTGDAPTNYSGVKSIINGEDSFVTTNPIYIPQLDSYFYISVTAPLDEINARSVEVLRILISFSIIVVTIIAFLLYYMIGKISAPLKEITESVDRIAGGDYNARITGTYTGEFAIVKDSVNTMADSIESYILESENSIKVMKRILNGLDAIIYVTIPETGEILFINDCMKNLYHVQGDGVGQYCYEVLYDDLKEKCSHCPCYKLDKDPDQVIIWEEHCDIINRDFRNTDRYIDWPGHGKVHLQHAVDITDIKHAQIALDKRLAQQALMTSISQSFLSDANIDDLIRNALHKIGEFMDVSQILFYNLEENGSTLTCLNEWISPSLDIKSRIGETMALKGSMLSIIDMFSSDRKLYLTSNDPVLKSVMAPYRASFESYITTPIFLKDKLCAVLDFGRAGSDKKWSESEINLAILAASLISGVYDRNFMENQLRMLSSIVESSPQFIIYVTSDGEVNYVNPGATKITGYTEQDLIGNGLDLIFDDKTVKNIKETYITEVLENGNSDFELNMICKDGTERIMSFSSFTTGSDSVNIGCIASDVTEMRKLESELISAKELAEIGSRSKSEFLSRMSHEIRTPMNAIIGMTNIAKNSDDPEKKEYCLDRIDNASRHLLGVINDILDMSKIEANKFELSFAEFSFEQMVLNVINVINFRIEEKHQTFTLHVDPSIPTMLIGDEQRLAQVITNLLTNAAKFTPEHGRIQLNAIFVEEKDEILTIRVETIDSGIGISQEQQSKLFRSFEQADGSIARKFGGTGLGLAISKRIVELMEGKIWVESQLGEGSKFIFTFNVKKGHHQTAESLKKNIDLTNLRIMAVDDSAEVCDYFNHVLNDLGIECVVSSDAEEALKLYKSSEKPFDLIFVDWQMPVMNGIELTKEFRKSTSSGVTPIIIMISVAEWSDIEKEATQAGVNGFAQKPLLPAMLMDCINKYLGSIEEDQQEDSGDAVPPVSFNNKTALLAEDVEINREIILTVLDGMDLNIECAEDGRQAIEMFSANPKKYDIIFMDIHMPEVDGLEATRRIRALDVEEGKSIPIVAMTANVFQEDIKRCLDAGMNDHIGKPINFDELFSKLKKYLG